MVSRKYLHILLAIIIIVTNFNQVQNACSSESQINAETLIEYFTLKCIISEGENLEFKIENTTKTNKVEIPGVPDPWGRGRRYQEPQYELQYVYYSLNINLTIWHCEVPNVKSDLIPPHNKNDIYTLTMNNVGIKIVFPGAFDDLKNLVSLYLKGNKIESIPANIFTRLTNLKHLQLGDNYISDIGKYAFVNQHHLSVLNLTNNNISFLSPNIFDINVQIDYFSLEMNRLTVFEDFSHLKVDNLILKSNLLESFDFLHVPVTTNLIDLSNNQIYNILHSKMRVVNELELNYNKLEVFPEFLELTKAHFNFNNLSILNNKLFHRNLEELYLENNHISQITFGSFFNLTKLKVLSLQFNNLSELSSGCFKDLTKLTQLNLAFNNLKIIQHGIFDNLDHLIVLNISNNKLSNYDQFLIKSLNVLDLSYNQIDDLNVKEISVHFHGELYLNGNNWKCNKLKYVYYHLKSIGNATIKNGNSYLGNNVKGIACEMEVSTKNETDLIYSESNTTILDPNFQNTEMYNFFNKEFLNSNFYKYLESLKSKNEVDSVSKTNSNFQNSEMYNFFNKEFRSSNFYKYLENLKRVQVVLSANQNQSEKAEKIVRNINFESSSPNYNHSYNVTIIIILFVILSIKMYKVYVNKMLYFRKRHTDEEQELH